MPTTYAHYIFGSEVLYLLPEKYREIAEKYRSLYDTGVHGPDILFYYDALKKNEVVSYGRRMHFTPARDLFENAKKVYESHEDKEAMMAYILGFLTHFAFDSTAHGYVDRKAEVSEVTHNRVESEYDRHLMELSGLDPNGVDRAESLRPTRFNAAVISRFFPFDERIIFKAIKGQRSVIRLLSTRTRFKRWFLKTAMNIAGVSQDLRDLPIPEVPSDRCTDSNLRLDKLKRKALDLFPVLFMDLIDYFEGRSERLCDYFDHDFEKWPDYQNIPILSLEEEANYTV